jgi:ElaB/YqjD/DUF883 family membrane-anchored ribosome-binding protein
MATQTDDDLAALQAEIQQLRADFIKIAGRIGDASRNGLAEAMDAEVSAEKVWTEIKRHAESVGRGIEERPIAAAFAAFGVGTLLGLLLSRRCG